MAVVLVFTFVGDLIGSSDTPAPVVSVITVTGPPGPPAPLPSSAPGYVASFTDVCGKTEQQLGLTAVGNFPFFRGEKPAGVTLNGNAWMDDNFGATSRGRVCHYVPVSI